MAANGTQRHSPRNHRLGPLLVWGEFCQGGAARVLSIFSSVSFFVRPGSRFFVPTCTSALPARAEAVKDGRVSAHRRLVLEGSEHDGTLAVIGMTTSRGAAARGTKHRATSLYAAGQRPRP